MTTVQYSLWKSMTIRRKFTVIAMLFTVLLFALIGFNVLVIEGQKTTSMIADVSGQQRMLSQKFAKEVLLNAMAIPADSAGTFTILRENMAALTDGGSVVLNVDTGERVTIKPAQIPEIRSKLAEEAIILRQLEAEASRLLAMAPGDPHRPEKIKEMLTLQGQVASMADQVVKMYDRDATQRLQTTIWIQIASGVVAAVIGLAFSVMISAQIADPLAACARAAMEIAQGNLRQAPQAVTSSDEIGILQQAFNDMLAGLRDISLQTRTVCDSLTLAAAQILTSTQEQAAGTKQQAAAVQEITTTVEQISASGKQVSERSRQVASTAEAVSASGQAGLQAVREASAGMEAIREQAETVAENVVALSERTQAVGEIIATVNDIAEQSNLVALNAAIEAADAREQGRRFSVVANEIKNLADQAKEATAQVRSILEQTQKGINTSVMLTEEALKRVESGREKSNVSEQVIRQMAANIQDSVHAFQQIVGATNQQQIGLEQVTQALHEIRQASQQTAVTTAQLEKASMELTNLGSLLSKTLEKYRL